MNVQSARRFEDLLSGQAEPAPYDYGMMFKADGFFARLRSKSRFKLLQGIDARLRRVLHPGEKVFFMTPGTTVSLGEQFFVGWVAYYLNARALVFTTERVLLLAIDRSKRAGQLVSQIPYTAIASVSSTWTGMCRVKLLNKESFNFQNVPKPDRKFLADFLADIVKGTNAPFERVQGLEHLCPHCFKVVPGHPDRCPACHGRFKSPAKAALRSLIFPGLGDWYLGHRGFAVLEMLGSAFLWLAFVWLPLLAMALPADPEMGEQELEPLDASYWITAAIIIGLSHLIDAMMTRHFARKGHHPDGPAPADAGPPVLRG